VSTAELRRVIGARLRAERKLRLWDVPEMARRLASAAGSSRKTLPAHDVLVGYVRRWEAGRAGVSDRFRMLYAAAFGMTEEDLFPPDEDSRPDGAAPGEGLPSGGWTRQDNEGLARMLAGQGISAGNAQRVAHEWLITEPPQMYEVRAGRRVGSALVTQVEARVAWLRALDDYIGGEDLREAVLGELTATAALLGEASYAERDGRRLLSVFADMCQIGGWIVSDAGAHAVAERCYLTGARAAFAAGDKPMAANLLSSLSYQVANVGDARQAVLLARSACAGAAREATPLMRALLAERAAWAYARLPGGQGSAGCERALGDADQAFGAQSSGVAEPPSVYWLDRGEMDVMAGRCYTELARPLKAEPLLVSVLARYDDTHAREKALYETWLAETYLHAREVSEAARAATRALDLSLRVHSARSRLRITHVRNQLLPHVPGDAAAREFEDHYRDAVA
jgi:transcriptional regulator with XRE-family HTH domain